MPDKSAQQYTLRAYGLLTNANNEVLLSKEKIKDFEFLKFPGGGVEPGEGIAEALKREFKEETGLETVSENLIYVTDFFVESKFLPGSQVIAVYYTVRPTEEAEISNYQPSEKDFDSEHTISLFWRNINEVRPDDFTFESDRRAWKAFCG
jgi:ADP-ribose pyrophosphatase YjhB (NUDIX family)